jgi:hypothetical protein
LACDCIISHFGVPDAGHAWYGHGALQGRTAKRRLAPGHTRGLMRCFARLRATAATEDSHQVGLYGSSSPLPPGASLPAAQMAAWLCTASTCCCSCKYIRRALAQRVH